MTSTIESITSARIGYALDTATLRHQIISTNIANANTEAYVPMRLSFSSELEQLQTGVRSSMDGTVQMFSPKLEIEHVFEKNGLPAKVELDSEVAAMAHNSMQYQALLKGLSRHYAVLNTAVSDGKK